MEIDKQLADAVAQVIRAEEEVGHAIIGQKEVIRQVILAILADGNVLLQSVPGLGKTQLVKTMAKVFDLSFQRIQFTPDLMPADVTGTNLIVAENGSHSFRFQKGPVFANFVLADEINRATPKTQSSLLEAMQEKTVTVGMHTYELPRPFLVMATQNPIENEGTYPLPEAQLDRFLFQIQVLFPTQEELKAIVNLTTLTNQEPVIHPILDAAALMELREIIQKMPIADFVMDYAMRLVVGTHPELPNAPEAARHYIANGASPRAAQAIVKTAKARAFLEGRFNVAFEDVRSVAYPALRHRLITNFEALSDGLNADAIIRQIIEATKEL